MNRRESKQKKVKNSFVELIWQYCIGLDFIQERRDLGTYLGPLTVRWLMLNHSTWHLLCWVMWENLIIEDWWLDWFDRKLKWLAKLSHLWECFKNRISHVIELQLNRLDSSVAAKCTISRKTSENNSWT